MESIHLSNTLVELNFNSNATDQIEHLRDVVIDVIQRENTKIVTIIIYLISSALLPTKDGVTFFEICVPRCRDRLTYQMIICSKTPFPAPERS